MNKIFINFLSNRSCPATQTKVTLSIYCNGVTVRSWRNGLFYIILPHGAHILTNLVSIGASVTMASNTAHISCGPSSPFLDLTRFFVLKFPGFIPLVCIHIMLAKS